MKNTEIVKLVKSLLSWNGENEWIEYKTNKTNPEEIGKWISALSNASCIANQKYGYLVFGVSDDLNVVGTNKSLKKITKGKEEIEHWLIQRLNPRLNIRLLDCKIDDKLISLIQIPKAQGQPLRFMKKGYLRIGSITRDLTDFPEKERLIWLSANNDEFEYQISKSSLEIDEIRQLLDINSYYQLLGQSIPSSAKEIIDRLEKENLIQYGEDRTYEITNLAGLLLAKSLKEFDNISRKEIRLIFYKNNNRIETEREYVESAGYAISIGRIIEILELRLPKSEIIEGALRKEISKFPMIALREIIANAIIHQDFEFQGTGPMIEVFQDRIEITNPGTPLIDVLRFIDSNPISRNEKLAYNMRMLNLCEERGSGVDKIVSACEVYQLPAPEFIVGQTYTRVILYSSRTFKEMSKSDRLRACYQHCSLKFVSGKRMTNSSLRERMQIAERNYPMVSRIISEAIKENLIKDANPESKSKKHAKYIPFWA